MYFDSHAHISASTLSKNADTVIQRSQENGVEFIVDAAIDILSSEKTLKLARKYQKTIVPTLGLHPELLIPGSDLYITDRKEREQLLDSGVAKLRTLYSNNRNQYKAVGECGLDYYWLDRKDSYVRKALQNGDAQQEIMRIKKQQQQLLQDHITFALDVQLPLVVHSRGAEKECFAAIEKQVKTNISVLFHSFTGDISIAKDIVSSGYYISVNGIITFPNAGNMREMVRELWKNHKNQILTETDAPYLAPQEKRGKQCEPADVIAVVKTIAEIVGEKEDYITDTIFENSVECYNLD